MDAFFNIEYKGNTWFDGLAISDHPEYAGYKNAFPVVRLDLKDTECDRNEVFVKLLKEIVLTAYQSHDYLKDSEALSESERNDFLKVINGESEDICVFGIPDLCSMLRKHHGTGVVVLIDEYDRAVSDSFGQESHLQIMKTLDRFLSPILKGNDSLQMAYVTGIMQIAKESIFSGLNNLIVNNVFSKMSNERFGFTEPEVEEIFAYYGHPEKFGEAKDWYDGYRFGDAEVYNPFSIMNYVSDDFVTGPYWVNSGSDVVMRWLLERICLGNFSKIMSLISGGSIGVRLKLSLPYSDFRATDEDLYSLMVMSGYLKAVPYGNLFEISLPNREISGILDDIMHNLRSRIDPYAFEPLTKAILEADSEKIESELTRLYESASKLILTTEHHYELVLSTALFGLYPSYYVTTERDSGNRRVDIILVPKREGDHPLIIELKLADRESDLDASAGSAIKQIHERKYYLNMSGEIRLIGIAFWGKMPKVVTETIRRRRLASTPGGRCPRIGRGRFVCFAVPLLREEEASEFVPLGVGYSAHEARQFPACYPHGLRIDVGVVHPLEVPEEEPGFERVVAGGAPVSVCMLPVEVNHQERSVLGLPALAVVKRFPPPYLAHMGREVVTAVNRPASGLEESREVVDRIRFVGDVHHLDLLPGLHRKPPSAYHSNMDKTR